MPSEGRRLHGFTVVSGTLGFARQLILPAILGGASAGDDLGTTLQWTAIILAVPSILLAVARWMVFRFQIVEHDLVIDSGVLSRRRRVIPIARIQNVDLRQGALERLAGVAELRMETASGSGETEASLEVLALEEARALQGELLRLRTEARRASGAGTSTTGATGATGATYATAAPGERGIAPTDEEPADEDWAATGEWSEAREWAEAEEPEPLLRLSIADLALAGATSNEAGLIAAGLATALELVDDLAGVDRLEAWLESVFLSGTQLGLVGVVGFVAVLGLAVVVIGWALSIVVTTVRYHGFTLTRVGDDIRREYGLFSRHHSTVPLERVQAVRIEETLLRRPLGLAALKIETAGAGPQQRQGGTESEAFVPIARRAEVGRLLREVFPDARFEGVELESVSPLSRRRGFLRLAVPIVIAAAAVAWAVDERWLALLALLLPAWLYASAAYRARGWARAAGYAIVRGGVFTRVSWVVPTRKVQTLHVADTPFQRRLGLGTLLVDTAAGGRVARVVDLERPTAVHLLHALAPSGDGSAH